MSESPRKRSPRRVFVLHRGEVTPQIAEIAAHGTGRCLKCHHPTYQVLQQAQYYWACCPHCGFSAPARGSISAARTYWTRRQRSPAARAVIKLSSMRHLPESRREAYRQLAVSRESVWSVADLQVLGIDIPQGVRHKWLIAASARACLRDPLTQAKLICFKLTPLGRELGRRLIQAQQRQLQRQLKKEA